ncbi:MAG: CoA-binding protein, partial [Promethearchaeota archaeon]
MSEMDVFFNPKTVAIIGASEKPRFGGGTTLYLLNSKFKTYPININSDTILGHKAYKNIKDVPDEIDLAIIIVGNEYVLQSVKDCIEKGVKGIIIESAGFAETG